MNTASWVPLVVGCKVTQPEARARARSLTQECTRRSSVHFSDVREVFESADGGWPPLLPSGDGNDNTLEFNCTHSWICARGRCHVPVRRVDFVGETPLVREIVQVAHVLGSWEICHPALAQLAHNFSGCPVQREFSFLVSSHGHMTFRFFFSFGPPPACPYCIV